MGRRGFGSTLFDFKPTVVVDAFKKDIPKEIAEKVVESMLKGELTKDLKMVVDKTPQVVKVGEKLEELVKPVLKKVEQNMMVDTVSNEQSNPEVDTTETFAPDAPQPTLLIAPTIQKQAEKPKAKRVRKKLDLGKLEKKVGRVIRKKTFRKLKNEIMKSNDVKSFISSNKEFILKLSQKDKLAFLDHAKTLM